MFDSLKCYAPLPNPDHQGLVFQTKDLDCALGRYVITHDGKLAKEVVLREWVNTPSPDLAFSWLSPGHFVTIDRWWERVYYHGDIVFYGEPARPHDHTPLVEYVARFSKGELLEIFPHVEPLPAFHGERIAIDEPDDGWW